MASSPLNIAVYVVILISTHITSMLGVDQLPMLSVSRTPIKVLAGKRRSSIIRRHVWRGNILFQHNIKTLRAAKRKYSLVFSFLSCPVVLSSVACCFARSPLKQQAKLVNFPSAKCGTLVASPRNRVGPNQDVKLPSCFLSSACVFPV